MSNPWEFDKRGSYTGGEYINGIFTYYEFYPKEKAVPENNERYSFTLTDEKYHQYVSLVITSKHIRLKHNGTSLSDEELTRYIAEEVFREENEETRKRNNKKRRESRIKQK